MSFLHITHKDLLISIRDKESWFILILMPVVLTLIFSAVFGGTHDDLALFPIQIGIVNLDQPTASLPGVSLSQQFLHSLESEGLQDLFQITHLETETELQKQIESGTLEAGILLPSNFSASLLDENSSELKVYGDGGSTLVPGIVQQIVDGFLTILEANRIRMQTAMTVMAENYVHPQTQQQLISQMMTNPDTQLPINFTQQVEEGRQETKLFQYYAAAMAVMFLLFTGNMGIFSILEERTDKTILRLKTGHLSKFSLLFGKFLTVLIMGIAQITILILFSHLFLKVHWSSSIVGLIYITLAGITSVAALSIFIAAITKSAKTANAVNWIAIQVLAFLGGSYFPIRSMPPFFQTLSKFTVNGQALQGYLTLMEGGQFIDVFYRGLILFGFGAFFLILGSYLFQYGEEGI